MVNVGWSGQHDEVIDVYVESLLNCVTWLLNEIADDFHEIAPTIVCVCLDDCH